MLFFCWTDLMHRMGFDFEAHKIFLVSNLRRIMVALYGFLLDIRADATVLFFLF